MPKRHDETYLTSCLCRGGTYTLWKMVPDWSWPFHFTMLHDLFLWILCPVGDYFHVRFMGLDNKIWGIWGRRWAVHYGFSNFLHWTNYHFCVLSIRLFSMTERDRRCQAAFLSTYSWWERLTNLVVFFSFFFLLLSEPYLKLEDTR